MLKKRIALVLALAILLGFTPLVNEEVQAWDAITQFEDLGDSWAAEALTFAVKNEILKGKTSTKLMPEDNLTRAEIATIVTRLFNVKEMADISHLSDVVEKSASGKSRWFYEPISKAVAMGAFKGEGNSFEPLHEMSREEIFVVLSRVFKVEDLHPVDTLENFIDLDEVSNYAKGPVMSMLNAGYVNGIPAEDGKFKVAPHEKMSRAEFAQVIYNFVEGIIKEPGVYYQEDLDLHEIFRTIDNVIISAPGVVFEDIKIEGNLYISDALEHEDIVLTNVEVKGDIIVRSGNLILKGNSSAKNIYVGSRHHTSEVELKENAVVENIISESQLNLIGKGSVGHVRLKDGAQHSVISVNDVSITVDKGVTHIRDKYGKLVGVGQSYINKSEDENNS